MASSLLGKQGHCDLSYIFFLQRWYKELRFLFLGIVYSVYPLVNAYSNSLPLLASLPVYPYIVIFTLVKMSLDRQAGLKLQLQSSPGRSKRWALSWPCARSQNSQVHSVLQSQLTPACKCVKHLNRLLWPALVAGGWVKQPPLTHHAAAPEQWPCQFPVNFGALVI